MIEAIQLHISLDGSEPLIWRKVLIPKEISFFKLHQVIQISMGWTNSHLFEFNIEGFKVGISYDHLKDMDVDHLMDSKETYLTEMISEPGECIKYWYDFGDSWMHTINFEKYFPLDKEAQLPYCTSGELNCPPEDCGGIAGFYDLLSNLSNKKHEDYKSMKRWVGSKYDPSKVDFGKINRRLKNMDKYIY
jgi:hypothetical protein